MAPTLRLFIAAVVGAFLISLVWAALLFKGAVDFTLDPFDVFTTVIAVGSITLNILQWRESKALLTPVRNPLIALFNELKARQQRVWSKRSGINPASTPVEFHDFTDEMLQSFEQLREHVLS